MTVYQELVDDVLRGFEKDETVVDSVDQQTIMEGVKGDGTFCDLCGTTMHFEGWRTPDRSHYVALAVCNNTSCGNAFQF